MDVAIDPTDYSDLPYQNLEFSLGLVYVCEGSCIGNQRVLAALSRHERFNLWNSQSFLRGSKISFSKRWKTLLHSIDELSSSASSNGRRNESSNESIKLGAIAGFEVYMKYWQALDNITLN